MQFDLVTVLILGLLRAFRTAWLSDMMAILQSSVEKRAVEAASQPSSLLEKLCYFLIVIWDGLKQGPSNPGQH